MFDLENQIQAWRQSLAGLDRSAEVIEELESHLREAFQGLVLSGQKPDRAWEAALERLGTTQQLATEFQKIPTAPLAWLPGRLVLGVFWAVTVLFSFLLLIPLSKGNMDLLLAAHVFAVTTGYLGMFGVGMLAVWSLLARAAWGWDNQRAATLRYYALRVTLVGLALTILGVVLGACWSREHLGHFWGWDVKEIGGLVVLVWYGAIVGCLHAHPSGWLTAMLVGVGGNIVVSLSWFGAILISPLHAYGTPDYALFLVGFVVLQLMLMLLALMPARPMNRQHS